MARIKLSNTSAPTLRLTPAQKRDALLAELRDYKERVHVLEVAYTDKPDATVAITDSYGNRYVARMFRTMGAEGGLVVLHMTQKSEADRKPMRPCVMEAVTLDEFNRRRHVALTAHPSNEDVQKLHGLATRLWKYRRLCYDGASLVARGNALK